MFESRIDRLRERIAEEGLDALIVTDRKNREYLSGFTGSAGFLLVSPRGGVLATDFRYEEQAKAQSPHLAVYRYETPRDGLSRLVQAKKVDIVGFEAVHTSCWELAEWEEDNPDITWRQTRGLVESQRICKDEEEIRRIRQAARLTDKGFEHILEYLRPGVQEQEVALELEFFLRREGAEGVSFAPIVASGPNSALPHAQPGDRILESGDFVVLDFGVIIEGYCSDLTRTVVIGRASDRQREIYELVLKAQRYALGEVAPGKDAAAIDKGVRDIFAAEGVAEYFGHGLGHGVGLEVHEEPTLSSRSKDELRAGMLVTVEPGLYFPGWGGVRIEDLVLLTSQGMENLSSSPKDFLVL